jgi:phage tail-like protein
MSPLGSRVDPHNNFNFLVEIGGVTRYACQEVSGLESTTDVIEHRESGDPTTPRKLPGQTKYANIVLKRGITSDDDYFFTWHEKVVNGKIERQNGSIILLDNGGDEARRWNFVNAWPAKWTGPSLTAEGNDVAIETLELAHEGLVRG